MAVLPGTRMADRYVVEEELGAGGMGVVVRAMDERLGRAVALKLLAPHAVGDAVARERLLREARAAAALLHPGIVHVYDVEETEEGGAFLVMELVRGKTLKEMLVAGTMTLGARARVVIAVARALGFAHAAGFVHRDVKPVNIMVCDDGRAMMLDFGMAKKIASTGEAPQPQLTIKGAMVGTPRYFAPEQAREEQVDARADQFALGVTAYEALTGRSPWNGSTVMAIVAELLRDQPAPPSSLHPGLSTEVDAVIGRAMDKRKENRYPTIDAFADALEALLPSFERAEGTERGEPQ
jgi:serine/threonine protein kinase